MKAFFENESELKKFLNQRGSICREERQFALFLYLVFLKKKRKEINSRNEEYINEIVNKCLCLETAQEVDIIDVYYEATLMRDYWASSENGKGTVSKDEFNRKVLHFCLDFQIGAEKAAEVIDKLLCNNPDLISQYLGQKGWKKTINSAYYDVKHLIEKDNITDEEKHRVKIKAGLDIAGMMMNAIPDILVIYKLNDKLCAKALECKNNKLREGKYRDVMGIKNKMQLFIQECIMNFCFGGMSDYQRHIPNFPKSPVWKEYEKLWEETCQEVYEGILGQNIKAGPIKNCGVEIIRFIDKAECNGEGEILVDLEKLLEKIYSNIDEEKIFSCINSVRK